MEWRSSNTGRPVEVVEVVEAGIPVGAALPAVDLLAVAHLAAAEDRPVDLLAVAHLAAVEGPLRHRVPPGVQAAEHRR